MALCSLAARSLRPTCALGVVPWVMAATLVPLSRGDSLGLRLCGLESHDCRGLFPPPEDCDDVAARDLGLLLCLGLPDLGLPLRADVGVWEDRLEPCGLCCLGLPRVLSGRTRLYRCDFEVGVADDGVVEDLRRLAAGSERTRLTADRSPRDALLLREDSAEGADDTNDDVDADALFGGGASSGCSNILTHCFTESVGARRSRRDDAEDVESDVIDVPLWSNLSSFSLSKLRLLTAAWPPRRTVMCGDDVTSRSGSPLLTLPSTDSRMSHFSLSASFGSSAVEGGVALALSAMPRSVLALPTFPEDDVITEGGVSCLERAFSLYSVDSSAWRTRAWSRSLRAEWAATTAARSCVSAARTTCSS